MNLNFGVKKVGTGFTWILDLYIYIYWIQDTNVQTLKHQVVSSHPLHQALGMSTLSVKEPPHVRESADWWQLPILAWQRGASASKEKTNEFIDPVIFSLFDEGSFEKSHLYVWGKFGKYVGIKTYYQKNIRKLTCPLKKGPFQKKRLVFQPSILQGLWLLVFRGSNLDDKWDFCLHGRTLKPIGITQQTTAGNYSHGTGIILSNWFCTS